METTELKRFWNDITAFQPSEKRAIIALLIIGLGIAGIAQYKPRARSVPIYFYHADTTIQSEQFFTERSANEFANSAEHIQKKQFNPNTASVEVLMSMGLKAKVAHTIIHYRNKGGKFFKKEDLKKIYGLSANEYNQIEAFISLDSKGDDKENSFSSKEPKREQYVEKTWTIDVNKADQEEFEKLYGIGKYLANKIVHFRNKLGGFHHIEQVGETYGLEDSTFQKIKSKLVCPNPELHQLSINESTYETLEAHPYISKYLAEDIVKYREKNGKFTDLAQLLQLKNIKSDFQKIIPYLTL